MAFSYLTSLLERLGAKRGGFETVWKESANGQARGKRRPRHVIKKGSGDLDSLLPHLDVFVCLEDPLDIVRFSFAQAGDSQGRKWHRLILHILDIIEADESDTVIDSIVGYSTCEDAGVCIKKAVESIFTFTSDAEVVAPIVFPRAQPDDSDDNEEASIDDVVASQNERDTRDTIWGGRGWLSCRTTLLRALFNLVLKDIHETRRPADNLVRQTASILRTLDLEPFISFMQALDSRDLESAISEAYFILLKPEGYKMPKIVFTLDPIALSERLASIYLPTSLSTVKDKSAVESLKMEFLLDVLVRWYAGNPSANVEKLVSAGRGGLRARERIWQGFRGIDSHAEAANNLQANIRVSLSILNAEHASR